MPTVAVLELLAGLLDFTTQCYPDRLDNVDGVLASAVTALSTQLTKCVMTAERESLFSCDLPSYVLCGSRGAILICWQFRDRPCGSCACPLLLMAFLFAGSAFAFVRGALSEESAAVAVRLLTLPQEKLSIRVLSLHSYPVLMSKLVYRDRRYILTRFACVRLCACVCVFMALSWPA